MVASWSGLVGASSIGETLQSQWATPSVRWYLLLLIVVACERLLELRLSRQHAAWAFAQGGREAGQGHFGFMKLLHTALLVGCVAEVLLLPRTFVAAIGAPMLVLAIGTQLLRYWAIRSLGKFWNVRVIVVPGANVPCRGPYRWLRHPNYVAVVLEGMALPLIHGAWITALVFTTANAVLLWVRIRCEEAALLRYSNYGEVYRQHARFVPRRPLTGSAGHS